jgi:hypothetical protein
VQIGRAVLDGRREQRVNRGDRRLAGREVADVVNLGGALLDAVRGRNELDLRPVRAGDRELQLAQLGDGKREALTECEPQVVRSADVRRIGDRKQ